MAIVKIVTAENGTTGAQVAQGSSVGGDPVDTVVKTGTGSITIDETAGRQANGTKSLRVTTTATADTALLGLTFTDSPKLASIDTYIYLDALPAVNMTVLQIRNGGALATLVVQSNGRLLASFTGGSGTVLGTGDTPIAPGTLYRLALAVDIGATGTGDGTVNAAIYAGTATTPIKTFSTTTANLGTALLTGARIGKLVGGEATTAAMNFDDFRITTGTAALLPVGNTAPTVSAGADQANVEPWATVTLTGTDSDSDGTIAARSWTQTAGSPTATLAGTGATRTFEAPGTIAGTTLTFSYAVTDNAGATASDTMAVTVLPVTERAVIGGVEVPMRVVAATAVVGTTPDPATVTGLVHRWRADSIAQANGTAVATWPSLTGGASLTQGTAANQPTYITSGFGGQPTVRFTTASQHWLTATLTAQSQPYTVVMVHKLNRTAAPNQQLWHAIGQIITLPPGYDAYGGVDLMGGTATTAPAVLTWVANGATSRLLLNGTQVAAGDSGASGIGATLRIGANTGNTQYADMDLSEVLVYTGAKSDTELSTINSYVRDYYGMTVA